MGVLLKKMFLRRLLTRINTVEKESLHHRAAKYLLEQNKLNEAIKHLLKAGNYQKVVDLLDNMVMDLFQSGKIGQLKQWLKPIPEKIKNTKPKILLIEGFLLLVSGQLNQVEAKLLLVDKAIEENTDNTKLNIVEL